MVGGFGAGANSNKLHFRLRILARGMELHPAVRASAVRDTLAFLDKFEPGARARVLAKVPEVSRAIIDATSRSAWIGIEHDHYTVDAIVELFGRARAMQFWALAISELSDKPLLKAFVSGMFKWMPVDLRRVVSIFATGWPLVYRDMCTLEVTTSSGGHVALVFGELAPLVRRHRNYLLSWQGGCAGFAKLAGLSVDISFQIALDLGSAEAEFVPRASIEASHG